MFSLNRPSNTVLADYYQGYLKSLSNVSELEIDKGIQILNPYLRDHSHILEIGGGQSGLAKRLTSMGHIVFHEDPSISSEAEAIKFNSGFDLICSYYVGEHVLDVNEWVAYQRDLLRSDGHILIEVPNFARHGLESMNNEHINHFQMGHLQRLLIKHGFSIIAASESNVGRYFGMWVVGKVNRVGSLPPPPYK